MFGFMTDSVFHQDPIVTTSFCDLVEPIESQRRETYGKNTARPIELTDFKHFWPEHQVGPKSIFVISSAERPGTGITLWQGNAKSHTTICNVKRRKAIKFASAK